MPSSPSSARRASLVARACRLLEGKAAPDLVALAKDAGLSPTHFHRMFKEQTGLTPKAYAQSVRATRVRETLLKNGSVTDAMVRAGFRSSGRFYEQTDAMLGMTPSAYRAGGKGMVIRFAVGQCSLGAVLVAATDKGLCAITLGDDPDLLARELQDRFPRAEIRGADRAFEKTVAKVVGLVEYPGKGLDLPLDVRGTAFQQRVWEALRKIPAGTTASYAIIAREIGLPKAFRAVAQACGANPLAVAIPCHRVVRTDGGLSGYRWGVRWKKALLERERK